MSRRDEDVRDLACAVMTLIESGHRRISAVLDLTRVQVLGLVTIGGPIRPADIAATLGLTKSAVSRHLTALQEAGQIEIHDDPGDARTFLVEPTERGRGETRRTTDAGIAQFARATREWSDADLRHARMVVERLLDAWSNETAPDNSGQPTLPPTRRPRWTRRQRLNGDPQS